MVCEKALLATESSLGVFHDRQQLKPLYLGGIDGKTSVFLYLIPPPCRNFASSASQDGNTILPHGSSIKHRL